MSLVNLECRKCHDVLENMGEFYQCPSCGARYLVGVDEDGQRFVYETIVKKAIEVGQMPVKSVEIEVGQIPVKTIKLSDNVQEEIHRSGTQLESDEMGILVEGKLANKEWEAAQNAINQWLTIYNNPAEARWYVMMLDSKSQNWNDLIVKKFRNMQECDKINVDYIIQNSSLYFSKRVLTALLVDCNRADEMYFNALSLALPYVLNKDNQLFDEEQCKQMIGKAFETAISKKFTKTFMYLIKHALQPDEIDKYIDYTMRFAKNAPSDVAMGFYRNVLKVDPANADAIKSLIELEIKANTNYECVVSDVDDFLKYSNDVNSNVMYVINTINAQKWTYENTSNIFWAMLERYQGELANLRDDILKYGTLLLKAKQWLPACRYFELMLTFNRNDPDAYHGMFLCSMQATSDRDALSKPNSIADNRYYQKALVLYKKNNNERRYEEMNKLSRSQGQPIKYTWNANDNNNWSSYSGGSGEVSKGPWITKIVLFGVGLGVFSFILLILLFVGDAAAIIIFLILTLAMGIGLYWTLKNKP